MIEKLLKRWRKHPKKIERFYLFYTATVVIVNLLVLFGFLFFIYLLWTRS